MRFGGGTGATVESLRMSTVTIPATAPPSSPPKGAVRAAPYPMLATRSPMTTASLRRFTVDEYQRMIRDGYFAPDERFELLEGLIVEKMPRDPIHDAAVEIADQVLSARLPAGWRVRTQSAMTTGDSQPEPDVAVVRGTPRDHLTRHPGPQELALVMEVSNTTLADDRGWKGGIYARAGIVTYWILNLADARVEVYSDPTGPDAAPAYRHRQDYVRGQVIPLVVDGVERGPVTVDELLP